MKNIKLMLLSLVLFAVTGGILAFKAKYNNTWCITTPKNGTCPVALNCATFFIVNAATAVNPGVVSCTTATNGLDQLTQDICTDMPGVTKKCVNTRTVVQDGMATQTVLRQGFLR